MPEDGWSPGAASAASPASSSPASSQTERDYLKEAEVHNDRPQTPQHRRGHSEPHNAFSPMSSPQLPSPMTMSLYRLGIGSSPLSPLRRQFSSSFSNNSASPAATRDGVAGADDELSEPDFSSRDSPSNNEDDDDDLTQDSKDVLVDRLNDLLKRLSAGGSLGGANITTLHAKVDEMEKVLASDHHKPSRPTRVRQRPSILQLASPLPIVRSSSSPKTPEEQHHPDYWGFSRTPPRQQLASPFYERSSPAKRAEQSLTNFQTETLDEEDEPRISSEVADSLVTEAEKLCTELSAVVKNLQDRREESDARPLAPLCQVLCPVHPANIWYSISTRCSLIEQRLQLSESWS